MKTIDVWRIVILSEAGRRSNVKVETLRAYAARYDDFPKPFLTQASTHLYDYLAVSDWLAENAPYGYKIMKPSRKEELREAARQQYRERLQLAPEPSGGDGVDGEQPQADEDGDEDTGFLPRAGGLG